MSDTGEMKVQEGLSQRICPSGQPALPAVRDTAVFGGLFAQRFDRNGRTDE
jgi:hypothetical protein